jgi:hypothetical protein
MKCIKLIFLVAVTFCASFTVEGQLRLTVVIVGAAPQTRQDTFTVKATICNISKDTVRYLNMDCDYTAAFTTGKSMFHIVPPLCYKNGPDIYTLAPGEKHNYFFCLRFLYNSNRIAGAPRVGFYWVKPTSQFPFVSDIDESSASQVVWSDPVKY